MDAESLARLFHETYERLAPEHGYETRKASAVPWEQVPQKNKALMIAVTGVVESELRTRVLAVIAELRKKWERIECVDGGVEALDELRAKLEGNDGK